ncbi:MAG: ComEC/Rec2 family competence protein [Clostridiales bacterium]|nr:ComEC/Rec2 family competence protein [Clostridiales bacterium]
MFLKDFLPEISLPSAALAFIAGIALCGWLACCLSPLLAAVLQMALTAIAAALILLQGRLRQRNLDMSREAIVRLRFYLSQGMLLLMFCLGFLQMAGASWPSEGGRRLPEGFSVAGAGVVEEVKALKSGAYSGPRFQILLRLQEYTSAAGSGQAGAEELRLWERQGKILLTIHFGLGGEGESGARDFERRCIAGAQVRFVAAMKAEEAPRNPGEFDYAAYLRTKGVYCQGEAQGRDITLTGEASAYRRFLADLRSNLDRQLEAYLSLKAGAIIRGCLLGDSSYMEREDREIYRQAGISHLFSVSGTHGGILLAAAFHLERFRFFRKRKALCRILALGLLFFYLSLTGFPLSMKRSFIMACMTQAAIGIRRRSDTRSALATAALFLLWFSPQSLFSAGFQLSFGVVLGIVHLSPWLGKRLPPLLAVPVAAQLASLPIQAYWFYQIQPLGFLINLWAVSIMPPLLLLSGFSALAGQIHSAAAAFLWQVPGFLAEILDLVAGFWVTLPFATYTIGEQPWPAYMIGGAVLWLLPGWKEKERALEQWIAQRHEQRQRHEDWRRWQSWRLAKKLQRETGEGAGGAGAGGAGVWPADPKRRKKDLLLEVWLRRRQIVLLCAALYLTVRILTPHTLEITFLDVGQGDGLFFVSPSGKVWMVDGGSSNVSHLGYYRLEPFLRSRGVSRLDYVLISHADEDHISGIRDLLLSGWRLKYMLMAPQVVESKEGEALAALAEEKGTAVVRFSAGQQVRDGELVLRCLYPEGDETAVNSNALSIVAELRYKQFSLLLTGDIDADTEDKLLKHLPETSLLKVAHHGSGGSSGTAFLEKVKPLASVISCSKNNLYGHPHPDTLERLKEAGSRPYLTMDAGAVRVRTNGKSFRISGYIR